MGIIQDQRPRDWAYKVAFDEKDLPSLQDMMKHIRETHDTDMIEDFNTKCEQKLAGEKATFNGLELQEVTKTDDLVTNPGLQQCLNIILGTSATRWSHFRLGGGGGGVPVQVTDTVIDTTGGGPFFLPMSTLGWMEAKGMKLFFGVIGPQATSGGLLGTSSIGEIGVDNGGTVGSTLLNRENFFNNRLTRTFTPDLSVYTSVFLFSCVIELCPVA